MEVLMVIDVALGVVQIVLLVRLLNKASRVAGNEIKEVEPMISDERFYSLAAVASMVGSHPMTVRRWIRSGRLSAYRVGADGRYKIAGEDLRVFLGAKDAGVKR